MRAKIQDVVNTGNGLLNVKILLENSEKLYVDGEGGQLGDRGEVEGNKIIGVKKIGKDLWITLKTAKDISIGTYVNIDIDHERRIDIAQQHSAQHLLTAVLKRELDVDTVGFQMSEAFSTIDIALGLFTEFQRNLIEDIVNKEIQVGHPINVNLYSPEEFKQLELRMRKELSHKILSQEKIRVVSIGKIDRNPCGGLHVKNTLEIGLLKITKVEKIKGNLTRLYFVAGNRALKLFQEEHEIIGNLIRKLTCGFEEIPDRVDSLLRSVKALKSIQKKYVERLADYTARELPVSDEAVIVYEDTAEIINAIPKFIERKAYVFVGISEDNKFILAAKGFDLRELFTHLKQKYAIQGGCGPTKGQFVTREKHEEILKEIKHWVERKRSYES